MNTTAERYAWPSERLGEALSVLARAARLHPRRCDIPNPESDLRGEPLDRWIDAAAAVIGVEAEQVEVTYGELENLVRRAAPALLRLPFGEQAQFLVLLCGGWRTVTILDPERRRRSVSVASVCAAIRRDLDDRYQLEADRLLDEAKLNAGRRVQARAAILAQRLSGAPLPGHWLLDLSPSGSFWAAARRAGVHGRATTMVLAHMAQHAVLLASWWVLGRSVLNSRLDRGWLLAWSLLLLTFVPLRALELWSSGLVMTRLGRLFKRRLMVGTFRLEPEEIRHQGVGQLLGRILNAESLRFLALNGTHLGVITLSELVLAFPVVLQGAGGWRHAVLLLLWVLIAFWLSWRYYQQRREWTNARLAMTHDLVEQMVGQRTRLAQERMERWHDREDRDLERYVEISRALDRRLMWLRVLIPRGWLLISLFAITPAFITGAASIPSLAVSIGASLFAYWSFWKMVRGLSELAEAGVAWHQVEPIFRAAARPVEVPPLTVAANRTAGNGMVLEAQDLLFHYGDRAAPSVAGCNLSIHSGDKLLVQGPSGGGKTTLASLLAGLRTPQSGLLLLHGLDRHSLGAAEWHRRVVAAPQFQDNHILTGTFAFNVLMGREWPAPAEDLEEAEAICRGLGLGALLDRMPAGVMQMVGESGWQLSHGEKSRVYIARALLQRARLVILDESFAALDPESLRQAMTCAREQADTLMVIAHP